ncbi:16S rRNA (guanine(966)-N(2))-methyltransferase RsmD [Gammaproteobacteria bacterium]|nr:16S rRNA (guanine(966)-N(2))-methyltransferase RsmD [Gammaproteobacteria bacterium]
MPKRKPHTKIIGGVHKGTKIPYKPSEIIRPTENRARETLFNWLMHDIEGAICLDMFSGTGALGIEALSRGADRVIFLEKNKDLCLIINNLLEKLSLKQKAEVIHSDSLKYPLEKLNLIFDIVFLDPPFRKDFLNSVYNKFYKTTLLHESSLIYVESEEELEINFMSWKEIKKSKGGQTRYSLYINES